MQGRDATATLSTPGGADVTISVSQIDIANDETQDPRLFEDDYDVASATGFRVWEASSLFVSLLKQRSVQLQFSGRCVLELGAGMGIPFPQCFFFNISRRHRLSRHGHCVHRRSRAGH